MTAEQLPLVDAAFLDCGRLERACATARTFRPHACAAPSARETGV